MKQTFVKVAALCLLALASKIPAPAQDSSAAPVEALLYSTMPSTTAHRPEMAMDGDASSYFRSVYGMSAGDTFLVLLSRAIPVQSVRVVSGDAENQDIVTNGAVETSQDGEHFTPAAAFDAQGVASSRLNDRPVIAVRVRVGRGRGVPSLVIREITIESPVKIGHVQAGPGRGFIDISRAPELASWAQTAERQMEEFWPDTAAMLYSDGFIPPNMVNVVYRTGPGVTPVAATGGGVMTVNTAWCRQHPDDTGLTVHETAHAIQAYSAYNPVWLVEGIADYIRWIKFEPQNYRPRVNTKTATYHDSYRTTALFLAWCELHYDSRLVTKLSRDVRYNKYTDALFAKYCGKDVDALWAEFVAAYNADPTHIITPPIPPADRPRALPTVKPGSGASVDISPGYKVTGFYRDGAHFPNVGGFDEGGAAYSADLLGADLSSKGVPFSLGPAGAPNVVACRGDTVKLPGRSFSSLWLLGAAVEGSQMAQEMVLTYSDGTKETLYQNFSDWFLPQSFSGESRALKMTHRNMADGRQDPRSFYVYSYGLPLNSSKKVQTLTLPNNPYVRILAVTLAD